MMVVVAVLGVLGAVMVVVVLGGMAVGPVVMLMLGGVAVASVMVLVLRGMPVQPVMVLMLVGVAVRSVMVIVLGVVRARRGAGSEGKGKGERGTRQSEARQPTNHGWFSSGATTGMVARSEGPAGSRRAWCLCGGGDSSEAHGRSRK